MSSPCKPHIKSMFMCVYKLTNYGRESQWVGHRSVLISLLAADQKKSKYNNKIYLYTII